MSSNNSNNNNNSSTHTNNNTNTHNTTHTTHTTHNTHTHPCMPHRQRRQQRANRRLLQRRLHKQFDCHAPNCERHTSRRVGSASPPPLSCGCPRALISSLRCCSRSRRSPACSAVSEWVFESEWVSVWVCEWCCGC